jgi:hypothetical protein
MLCIFSIDIPELQLVFSFTNLSIRKYLKFLLLSVELKSVNDKLLKVAERVRASGFQTFLVCGPLKIVEHKILIYIGKGRQLKLISWTNFGNHCSMKKKPTHAQALFKIFSDLFFDNFLQRLFRSLQACPSMDISSKTF